MVTLGWFIVAVALATFVVETAFMTVYSAERALRADALPQEARLVAYFWLFFGLIANIVFNLTRGSIIFRELPRWGEWMFSQRVQRHVLEPSGWRRDLARKWARFLNAVDPDHIRGLEP